jgi:hypothetical protein
MKLLLDTSMFKNKAELKILKAKASDTTKEKEIQSHSSKGQELRFLTPFKTKRCDHKVT